MSLPTATDAYFQGLLSGRLGAARQIDDELVMLILQDSNFAELCAEYGTTSGDQNGAVRRVAAKATSLQLPLDPPHNWAIWSAVLDDPRFDPIWKRVLDDLRDPLPIVRNSVLGRLLALLSKLKKPAETASVLPLLLGTAAAASVVWVAPAAWQYAQGNGKPPISSSNSVSVDLKKTDMQLAELNRNVVALSRVITSFSKYKIDASSVTPTPPTVTSPSGNSLPPGIALPPGGSLPIDWKPMTDALQGQGNILSSAISNLSKKSDENKNRLDQIHTELSADNSAQIAVLNKIEQHTAESLNTLSKDVVPLIRTANTDTENHLKSIDRAVTVAQGSVADLQQKGMDALALQEALKGPRFTVDNLSQGAFFLLALNNTSSCIALQVLRMNGNSVILRYKPLENCRTVQSANGALIANDRLTIRLNATPRFVSAASGMGAKALYLALEQERGLTAFPPSGKRTSIGIYTGSLDWAIKQPPAR